ncbi:NADP-dependent oxidoreductase [Acanthopleuribacter pedis]|uniref:NADP-dependent oxidoreductase n=1 Tax=Acanthopleuribacter pedis TaxID=442870 RepID=A0A8J7QDW9_9BACT|nr:NADP-dependent oxidoreductase [Acanthopleuribacter pedis]MBO1322374.1 NADP-dependent oxidoreductase [Acanthopleuribacter pedis]
MLALMTKGYGDLDLNPVVRDIALPQIGDRDVLIKVRATGINAIETNVLRGDLRSVDKQAFPEDRGADISGEIVRMGASVTGFSVGDQVFGRMIEGEETTVAEYVRVPQHQITLKPVALTHEQAASLPWAGLSAHQALFEVAELRDGEKLLVHGGDEILGEMAIQLAKAKGAYVITTIQGCNQRWVERLGADQVIDRHKQNFHELVQDVDVVFNPYGDEVSLQSFSIMKPGGRLVALHGAVDAETARRQGLNPVWRFVAGLRAGKVIQTAETHEVMYRRVVMRPDGHQLSMLATMVDLGLVKPVIDKVFPFSEASEAIRRTRSCPATGKVVVSMMAEQEEALAVH